MDYYGAEYYSQESNIDLNQFPACNQLISDDVFEDIFGTEPVATNNKPEIEKNRSFESNIQKLRLNQNCDSSIPAKQQMIKLELTAVDNSDEPIEINRDFESGTGSENIFTIRHYKRRF